VRIHIGGDHAAYDLQQVLITHLEDAGHDVVNHGPFDYDALDDFPAFVLRAAEAVAAEQESIGIVLGGSGNGEQMAANKVPGIRAALCYTSELAALAREHNDAHVVSIGARFTTHEVAKDIIDTFISTDFTNDERHSRRIGMVTAYESKRELPPLPESLAD
jgi:ribose 5-phosphate isomerase B